MKYEPRNSPWGTVDQCRRLCPGAFMVDTPRHGGVMFAEEMVNELLSKDAQKIGFRENGYLCFEEDCEATVAFRELMDRKLMTTYPGYSGTAEQFEKTINSNVQLFYPAYWQARQDRLASEKGNQTGLSRKSLSEQISSATQRAAESATFSSNENVKAAVPGR